MKHGVQPAYSKVVYSGNLAYFLRQYLTLSVQFSGQSRVSGGTQHYALSCLSLGNKNNLSRTSQSNPQQSRLQSEDVPPRHHGGVIL